MLRNLKIGQKLILIFSIIIIIFGAITGYQLYNLKSLGDLQNESTKLAENAVWVSNYSSIGSKTYQIIADAIINRDLVKTNKDWVDLKNTNSKIFSEIALLINLPEEKKELEKAKAAYEDVVFNFENVMLSMLNNKRTRMEDISKIDDKFDANVAQMEQSFKIISESIHNKEIEGHKHFEKIKANVQTNTLIAIGAIITLLLSLMLYFNRNINNILRSISNEFKRLTDSAIKGELNERVDLGKINFEFHGIAEGLNQTLNALITPLNVASMYIDKMAMGEIPQPITEAYYGEFNKIKVNLNQLIESQTQIINKAKLVALGDLTVVLKKRSDKDELMESLDDMVKSTSRIVNDVRQAANNIASASQQMSANSQTVSQGATQQASAAEEVSSSMEEMVSNIQQNTDNAQQTEKIAFKASDGIRDGNRSVEISVNAMKDIAEKIKIINDLSFQTNILALNAAVEAARAGEHGRGFAVVAAEVRKLAERSKIAADEIDELSRNGVSVSVKAGQQLSELVPEIEKTSKLVQEITAASLEQNAGSGQINNAILQLNKVTQQNAAASEEMATSAEELATQAQQMLDMMTFFRTSEDLSGANRSYTSRLQSTSKSIRKPEARYKNYTPHQNADTHASKNTGINIMLSSDHLNDDEFEKF